MIVACGSLVGFTMHEGMCNVVVVSSGSMAR